MVKQKTLSKLLTDVRADYCRKLICHQISPSYLITPLTFKNSIPSYSKYRSVRHNGCNSKPQLVVLLLVPVI